MDFVTVYAKDDEDKQRPGQVKNTPAVIEHYKAKGFIVEEADQAADEKATEGESDGKPVLPVAPTAPQLGAGSTDQNSRTAAGSSAETTSPTAPGRTR